MNFKKHIDFAKKVLEDTGSVTAQMVVPTPKGAECYMLMFDDDKSKEEMFKAMRKMVEVRQIDRYFVMNEGWMGQNLNVRPREDPKKKEGLMVFEFRRNGLNKGKIFIFHKDGKKIIYDDEMDMGDMTEFSSRFNFFIEDDGGERIRLERIKHNLEMFEKTKPDKKIKEFFNILKETKPEIVKGKTWQDMKDMMIKMIKEGKVSAK